MSRHVVNFALRSVSGYPRNENRSTHTHTQLLYLHCWESPKLRFDIFIFCQIKIYPRYWVSASCKPNQFDRIVNFDDNMTSFSSKCQGTKKKMHIFPVHEHHLPFQHALRSRWNRWNDKFSHAVASWWCMLGRQSVQYIIWFWDLVQDPILREGLKHVA